MSSILVRPWLDDFPVSSSESGAEWEQVVRNVVCSYSKPFGLAAFDLAELRHDWKILINPTLITTITMLIWNTPCVCALRTRGTCVPTWLVGDGKTVLSSNEIPFNCDWVLKCDKFDCRCALQWAVRVSAFEHALDCL